MFSYTLYSGSTNKDQTGGTTICSLESSALPASRALLEATASSELFEASALLEASESALAPDIETTDASSDACSRSLLIVIINDFNS